MLKGDIVSLERQGQQLLYKVEDIDDEKVVLKGLFHRTSIVRSREDTKLKVVSESDTINFAQNAIKANEAKIKEILKDRNNNLPKNKSFMKPKLLHIDADENYLAICMKFYEVMGIEAYGYVFDEPTQPRRVRELLKKHAPDILVVTGHDVDRDDNQVYEVKDYENSTYYVDTTKQARLYEPSKNGLVIIAGACQSDYERIMGAGANFASSPARIMIDVLDPSYIANSIAYTYFTETVTPEEAVRYTTTKSKGFGGVETNGVLRQIEPEFSFKQIKE